MSLIISRGGIDALDHGIMNVLSIDHQSLILSVLDLSLSAILICFLVFFPKMTVLKERNIF